MTKISKALVGVVAMVALLVLSAAPSAATIGTVSGGTITLNTSPTPGTISLAPGAGCGSGSPLTVAVATLGGSSPYTAATDIAIDDAHLSLNGGAYIVHGLRASALGTITTGSPGTISTGTFTSNVAGIYDYDTSAPCNRGAYLCPISLSQSPASGPYLALSGPFSGTVSSPGLSGSAILGGTGRITTGGSCGSLNGTTVTFSSISVSF